MNNSELFRAAMKLEAKGKTKEAYRYFLEAAISENDGEAMRVLARNYMDGYPFEWDTDKAFHYYCLAYENGTDLGPIELMNAGAGYQWKATEENKTEFYSRARECYLLAAKKGDSIGFECTGETFFLEGNFGSACEMFKMAGPKNSLGLHYMGRIYEEGLLGEKDLEKAIHYYKRSIEYGERDEEEYGEDYYCCLSRERIKALGV